MKFIIIIFLGIFCLISSLVKNDKFLFYRKRDRENAALRKNESSKYRKALFLMSISLFVLALCVYKNLSVISEVMVMINIIIGFYAFYIFTKCIKCNNYNK